MSTKQTSINAESATQGSRIGLTVTGSKDYGVFNYMTLAVVAWFETEAEAQAEVDRLDSLGECVCLQTPPMIVACRCGCGCKNKFAAYMSDYCTQCRRGMCGEDFTQEDDE